MPPPTIATNTPPSTRPLNASSKPAITIANSTRPVTNVPVEIVCALAPRLENGSCAQDAKAIISVSNANRASGFESNATLATWRWAGKVFHRVIESISFP